MPTALWHADMEERAKRRWRLNGRIHPARKSTKRLDVHPPSPQDTRKSLNTLLFSYNLNEKDPIISVSVSSSGLRHLPWSIFSRSNIFPW
jgi:hypothetical protein